MVPAEGTTPAKPLETLDVDTLPPTVNRGTLRLLVLDDCDEALVTIRHLRSSGYRIDWSCAGSEECFIGELERGGWDAILSEAAVGDFTALDALRICRNMGVDVPFLVVSRTAGESLVVETAEAGARDWLLKEDLERLIPVIERELRPASCARAPRRSGDDYRALSEAARDAIITFDENGHILSINGAAETIFSYSQSEILGSHISTFLSEGAGSEQHAAFAEYVRTGIRTRDWNAIVAMGRDRGGVEIPLEISLGEYRDAGERYFVAILRDVREKTDARKALEDSAQDFRGLFERIPDAFLILDPDSETILLANEHAAAMYGIPLDQLLGRSVRDFSLGPQDRSADLISAVKRDGHVRFETTHMGIDGSEIHLEICASETSYRGRSAILSVNRDITERVIAARALEDSQRLNQAVLDSLFAQVAVIDHSGTIVAVNQSWRDFARANGGESLAEPEGRLNYLEVARRAVATDPSHLPILEGIEQVLAGAAAHFNAEYSCHSDTEKRWFNLSVTPLAIEPRGAVVTHFDITRRRMVEDALRESEARQKQLLATVPVMVYTASLDDLQATHVSSTAANVTGFDESHFVTKRGFWRSRIHPEDRDRVISEYMTIRWKRAFAAEYRWLCADGQYKWFYDSAIVSFDDDGEPLEVIGSMVDINERKIADEAIRRSESRYRNLVESAPDVFYTLTGDGRIESLNPAFETITGWPAADFIGQAFDDLLHPDERDLARETFEAIVRGAPVDRKGWRIRTRTGDYVYLEGVIRPEDESGSLVKFSGVMRDFTERQRAEEERAALTRNLELILQSTGDGLIAVDNSGSCTMINRRGAEMFGYSPAELIGRKLDDLSIIISSTAFASDGSPGCFDPSYGSASVIESIFHDRSGRAFPVECTAAPIVDGESVRGLVISFYDTTDRKALEQKLEIANRLSAIGRIGATVAHEFNNVLMGIQPFADVLVRLTSHDTRAQSAAKHIAQSVNRGKRITHEILRFTQPAELELQDVDLDRWVSGILPELIAVTGESSVLEYSPSGMPIRLAIDTGQVHQVLLNLTINARDAMPDGGTIRINASRASRDALERFALSESPSSFTHITVSDTGPGIPPEAIEHVFEPLFTTKRSGTGLGLALAHQVITRHGGHIFAENAPEGGAMFHVFLPERSTAAEDSSWIPSTPPRQEASLSRLLLVEDDAAVAEGLAAVLALEGIEVEVVGHGAEVMAAVERFQPEAVVLDVGLPDISGIDVYRSMSVRWPELPVVFSTGHGDESQIAGETSRSRVGFLMKPYDLDALLEALTAVRS